MKAVALAAIVVLALASPVAAYDLWDCRNQFSKPGVKMYNGANFDGSDWTLCATGPGYGEDPKLGAGDSNEPYSQGVTGMANKIESIRMLVKPGCTTEVSMYDSTWYTNKLFTWSVANTTSSYRVHSLQLSPDDRNKADSVNIISCV